MITLKRQVPRLRDWNYGAEFCRENWRPDLKRQVPRLRDWNKTDGGAGSVRENILETTSTSITRLKLVFAWKYDFGKYPWNDKYLDYEIETFLWEHRPNTLPNLKRQVPRLRDWNLLFSRSQSSQSLSLKRQVPRLRDWNWDFIKHS